MKKLLSLCYKVPLACLAGYVVAVSLIQHDRWFARRLEQSIAHSMTACLGVPVSVGVQALDMLSGTVTLGAISAAAQDGSWSLSCPRSTVSLSCWSWCTRGMIDTHCTLHEPTIYSTYAHGSFALEQPLYALATAPLTVPLDVTLCSTEDAKITLAHGSRSAHMHASSSSTLQNGCLTTRLIWHDGTLEDGKVTRARHVHGTIDAEYALTSLHPVVTMKLTGDRGAGEPAWYHLYYHAAHGLSQGVLRAEDGSCVVHGERFSQTSQGMAGHIEGHAALHELAQLAGHELDTDVVAGRAHYEGTVLFGDTGITYALQGTVDDAQVYGTVIDHAALELDGTERAVQVLLKQSRSGALGLHGRADIDLVSGAIEGRLASSEPYMVCGLRMQKGRLQGRYQDGALTAQCKGRVLLGGAEPYVVRGTLTSDRHRVQLRGMVGGNRIDCAASLRPFKVQHITLKDQLHRSRVEVRAQRQAGTSDEQLIGTVDIGLAKNVLAMATGLSLSGAGSLTVSSSGTQSVPGMTVELDDASLKVPGTYSILERASARVAYDQDTRTMMLHDGLVVLQKGQVRTSRARMTVGPDGNCVAAHIPVQCQELLVSKHRDLFGTLSGAVTMTCTEGRWRCAGRLSLDHAQVRSNLLSPEVCQELMSGHEGATQVPCDLDLHLATKQPIKVKTNFFEGAVQGAVQVTGTTQEPRIAGTLEVVKGSFALPYKPFYITKGTLTLNPDGLEGPTIDITAKNTIKSYGITMRVAGSLQQPQISFEASPALSEERILTLLFAGTDHGSLTAAMPPVLVQQVADAIFGSDEQGSAALQFIKGILTPLKNLQLLPQGADKDEVRASLEVEFNERLRAKAQNTVSLSDDTHLELEYTVSDDVRLKAVRDKEGAMGGEVEMRWKF